MGHKQGTEALDLALQCGTHTVGGGCMRHTLFRLPVLNACIGVALAVVAVSANAGKPEWAGQGHGKNKQEEQHQQQGNPPEKPEV